MIRYDWGDGTEPAPGVRDAIFLVLAMLWGTP